jgi:Mg/Co/Ni transporter MgtE
MVPHEELLRIVRSLPRTDVQNRLMSVTDREMALAMMYLPDNDRNFLLSYVSRQKSDRVREELRLQEHIRITYGQYLRGITNVIESFRSPGPVKSMKSYLRPRR